MIAVLIVDIWKTTPFMALLILAGLQMVPTDIYEAAKIDGIHPVKVFWKVTLPLIRPALMVAVIFRGARRAAHLRPDLRADAEQRPDQVDVGLRARRTCSTSTSSRYGSAASTLLFLILAHRSPSSTSGSAA